MKSSSVIFFLKFKNVKLKGIDFAYFFSLSERLFWKKRKRQRLLAEQEKHRHGEFLSERNRRKQMQKAQI